MNRAELSDTLGLPVMEHEKASPDPSTDATNAQFGFVAAIWRVLSAKWKKRGQRLDCESGNLSLAFSGAFRLCDGNRGAT